MITGHDITTRIINHVISKIMIEKNVKMNYVKSTIKVKSGGLFDFRSIKSGYRYPEFLEELINWRDFINETLLFINLNQENIESIFNELCKNLYWPLLRKEIVLFSGDKDINYCKSCLDNLIKKIEMATETNGIFTEVLLENGEYFFITFRVKPWLRRRRYSNVFFEVKDEYNLVTHKGLLDSNGKCELKMLSGIIEIEIYLDNKFINKNVKLNKNKKTTIHPSVF